MTCWWTKGGSTVEADVKLNKNEYAWFISVPGSCHDSWSVEAAATHEFGHVFGLAHVSEVQHPGLTMSTVIKSCQDSEKTLGLGDVNGLQALY